MSTGPSIGAVLLLLAVCLAIGCASARSARETVSGWLGVREPPPRAYYVGASRAPLHREPDASSEVVGALDRHDGVLAYRVDGDFTFVRSERTGRSGWLRTAELIDELPPAPPEPERAKAVEPPPPAETPAEPEPAPEPAPTPEKSIFDPY